MIISRGMSDVIRDVEAAELGGFVVLWGVEWVERKEQKMWRAAETHGPAYPGWEGEESGRLLGFTAEQVGRGAEGVTYLADPKTRRILCCACKRGLACPSPGKHPRPWRGFEHGAAAPLTGESARALIAEMRYRPINLGIVPADDIIVIDIDPRNGGLETLELISKIRVELPDTLTVYTGGGGEHRYYWYEDDDVPPGTWRGSLGPGLDVKRTGGLLVAPPSVHITGRRYRWARRNGKIECPEPDRLPGTWLRAARHVPTAAPGTGTRSVGTVDEPRMIREMAQAHVGERNDTLFRLACWALEGGAELDRLRMAARSTGLSEREIAWQIRGAQRRVNR